MKNLKTQSILCVLDSYQPMINDSALFYAQKTAIEYDLPIAVIVCVHSNSDLVRLLPLEIQLKTFNIPLMTLIGDQDSRIAAAAYHLKPKKIFYQSGNKSSAKLVTNPINWPGEIASVQELIDTNGQAC